jgi:dATP/dGTP diphosphohydrolase
VADIGINMMDAANGCGYPGMPPCNKNMTAAERVPLDTRVFGTGATRDGDDRKLDYEGFLSPLALRRFAEFMHSKRTSNVPPGETLRSSDNWQKGIPKSAYMKSAFRHLMEWWQIYDGYEARDEKGNVLDVEEVLTALMFNVMGYLHEHLKEKLAHPSVPA